MHTVRMGRYGSTIALQRPPQFRNPNYRPDFHVEQPRVLNTPLLPFTTGALELTVSRHGLLGTDERKQLEEPDGVLTNGHRYQHEYRTGCVPRVAKASCTGRVQSLNVYACCTRTSRAELHFHDR